MSASRFTSSRNGNFVQMERQLLLQPVGTEKVEYLRRSSVCSENFPFDPRVLFAFQLVEPEILAKWKAPEVTGTDKPGWKGPEEWNNNNTQPRGGGYLTKYYTGRLRPEVQTLTLLYTIFERKSTPFVYLS